MDTKQSALILWLDEVGKDDVALVGGKNASLGELYQTLTKAASETFPGESIRVPYGFAVTAAAYRQFIAHNGLDVKIKKLLEDLDVGNIELLEDRGRQMRQLILDGTFAPELEQQVAESYALLGRKLNVEGDIDVAVRSSATAEDLPDASFAGQQETYLNIRGVPEVLQSIKKAFASLFTNRAISYRADKHYDHFDVALSVTIQKMVRSDRGCSGVLFTLDTESGFRDLVLINASWGLGELVVQGMVTPDEYRVFKPTLKKGFTSIVSKALGTKEKKLIYAVDGLATTKEVAVEHADRERFALSDEQILQLARWGIIIEEHYNRPMDIEWAYDGERAELNIVQARPETVQARASSQVLEEFVLTQRGTLLAQGAAVGAKIGQGLAHRIERVSQMSEFKLGEVLVTEITDPDWEPIMKMAAAIVTNAGGRTSHAAIVSRELGIPAIVGCGNATTAVAQGQRITVSCAEGEVGRVYDGLLSFEVHHTDLGQFQQPKTDMKLIAANPELSWTHARLPHRGVGLAREEFIISNYIKIHPNALIHFNELTDAAVKKQIEDLTPGVADKAQYFVEKLSYGIGQLGAAFYPYDVLLRFSDFKSNEYANLIGGKLFEPVEENPMMGWRGASRYYDPVFAQAFALECAAVKRVRETMGLWNVSVMIPFCRTPEEGKKVLDAMATYGLDKRITPAQRKAKKNGDLVAALEVWVMAEIPSNILQVDEFAALFDGFSIGSNDLTQLTLGLDRDSTKVAHVGNEKNRAVKKLIQMLIAEAHTRGLKVGICGQGPSDFPDFAEFLVAEGIDSISINPDTLIKASMNVRAVEQKLGSVVKQADKLMS